MTDRLKNFTDHSLLLERFFRFVERSRQFDCDYSLGRKGFEELNLLIRELTNVFSAKKERTDRDVLTNHGHGQNASQSYVSNLPNPRDVDIVLVMDADFRIGDAPRESRTIFAHADAEARFGASVFWVREGMLSNEVMGMLLETWQTKRDGSKRGIVEIRG